MADDGMWLIIKIILCFFCGCAAVFLHEGECTKWVIIACILSCLFFFPGIIFALWFVLTQPKGATGK